MTKPLTRIARSELRAITFALWQSQNGKCAICGKPIDITTMGRASDYVVDHSHVTGEIRGVLHRACNAAEGKSLNAIGSWGAKSHALHNVIQFAEQLVAYWKRTEAHGTGMMYPDHKTPEQQQAAAKLKKAKAAAAAYAKKKAANAKPK